MASNQLLSDNRAVKIVLPFARKFVKQPIQKKKFCNQLKIARKVNFILFYKKIILEKGLECLCFLYASQNTTRRPHSLNIRIYFWRHRNSLEW